MRRRLGLLVSAVVTVTIPGVLAVLAILGHEHAVTSTTAMSAAGMADESAVGPLPLAPASTVPAVRNAVATVQRTSGGPVTVYSGQAASQQARAMHMLVQAAAAGQATSYQGVEETRQLGVNGTVTVLSQVWHQGGGLTLIRTLNGATPVVSYDTGDRSPAGVFGVTSAQVTLLGKHYIAAYRGAATASGLPATIVEVYRFDGSLAARFWLDTRTMVPLRREDFDTADKLVSDDLFTQVQFGPLTERPTAAAIESPALAPSPDSVWVTASSPATQVALLAERGVRLPGTALAGLPLYAAGVERDRDRSGDRSGVLRRAVGHLALRPAGHAGGVDGGLAAAEPGWLPGLRQRPLGHLGRAGRGVHRDRGRPAADGGGGRRRAARRRAAGSGRPPRSRLRPAGSPG